MQEVYNEWIKDVNKLCLRILTAWVELDQHVIETAVKVASRARVFVRALKQKAYALNTNLANSLECCCL